jgi:hypothetical protein
MRPRVRLATSSTRAAHADQHAGWHRRAAEISDAVLELERIEDDLAVLGRVFGV